MFRYAGNFCLQKERKKLEKGFSKEDLPGLLCDKNNFIWIDIEAPTKEEEKILSEVFNFHPLTIEDAIETRTHPKIEVFSDYLFLYSTVSKTKRIRIILLPMNLMAI